MFFSNPSKRNLRVFEKDLPYFFENKSVIILGSAPSVVNVPADFMDAFDVIVRVNNYKHFNACTRTDVFYSMLGGSIMKTIGDLKKDGCKLIFCKNPFKNIIAYNPDGTINHLQSTDCRNGYLNTKNPRRHWFEIPYYIQLEKHWRWITNEINKVCTSGLAAMVDIYRYKPSKMHLAGYDFFTSGKHFIDLPVTIKPWPKHHDFKAEMLFMRDFIRKHNNITCSIEMQAIFDRPDNFPKIGSKPE